MIRSIAIFSHPTLLSQAQGDGQPMLLDFANRRGKCEPSKLSASNILNCSMCNIASPLPLILSACWLTPGAFGTPMKSRRKLYRASTRESPGACAKHTGITRPQSSLSQMGVSSGARVAEPKEMLYWVRGWGSDVQVLERAILCVEMAEVARLMAEQYGWQVSRADDSSPADTYIYIGEDQ